LIWLSPNRARNGSARNENGEYRVLELSQKNLDFAKAMNRQLVIAIGLKTALNFLLG
jgi:hypothetical protein